MKNKSIIFIVLAVALLFACENKDKTEMLFQEAEQRERDIVRGIDAIAQCRANYEKILLNDPTSKLAPVACLKLGKLSEIFGHYEEAIDTYRKLLSAFPEDTSCAAALLSMAKIYQSQLGERRKALELYDQLILVYPQTGAAFEGMVQRGMILTDYKKWQQAIEAFEAIIKNHPNHKICDDLAFRIADIWQIQLQDSLKAAEAYQHLIRTFPRSSWIKYSQERLTQIAQGGFTNEK
ncbi:tetratricopeptide repeat protein [candidate division KSB1 bacterium]|nr:tetratricopeptide repeat protein [candidate division KSB1 bacterium]